MKHCSAAAPQYEASPLCSDMKHSAFAPYDEKIKNESLLPENVLILIKSPQILRSWRSPVTQKTLSSSSHISDSDFFLFYNLHFLLYTYILTVLSIMTAAN